MELRDFIVTPIIIILVYLVAFKVRPYVTDEINRKYFLPALTVKIIGALALGFIYQFYYDGGDTFNFHTHGSRHIWEAFMDSPEKGLGLMFSSGKFGSYYQYSSKIPFFTDPPSFFIIRIAAFFDLITFSSYCGTAILFSIFSFVGAWMFFLTFYKQYPQSYFGLAIASFFIPSVFFWGSGVLKDTIVTGCLGIATYLFYILFFKKRIRLLYVVILLASLYAIFQIKVFVLQAYLPAIIMWIVANRFSRIRIVFLRLMLVPFALLLIIISGYFAISKVGEDNAKYSIENIANTARVTAYDIRYWTGRDAGSGYSLGELDGTLGSMLLLAPQAITVSLFRPYLWEVKNVLMLISAVESLCLLVVTVGLIIYMKFRFMNALRDPSVLFCMVFSISFAFAVGVSTYNFGTLVRYKIPLMPFYAVGLSIISGKLKK